MNTILTEKTPADTVADAMMNGILNEDFIPQWVKLFPIYKAYFKSAEIDLNHVDKIFEAIEGFSNHDKTYVYATYLGRPDTASKYITIILNEAPAFEEYQQKAVYSAYISNKNTPSQQVLITLEKIQKDNVSKRIRAR